MNRVIFASIGILLVGAFSWGGAVFFLSDRVGEAEEVATVGGSGTPERTSRLDVIEERLQRMDAVAGTVAGSEPNSLDRRLTQVEGQLAELVDRLQAFADAAEKNDAAPSPQQQIPDPVARAEQSSAAVAQSRHRRHEQFVAEQVDPDWSENAATQIQDSISDLPVRVQANLVDCRTRTCRLEVEFEGEEDLDLFLLELPLRINKNMPGMLVFNDVLNDGTLVSEVYLTRRSLPSAEEASDR